MDSFIDIGGDGFEALAATVGLALRSRGERLATAESCTGGWVSAALTAVAGSSQWFERGFVTYSNEAKFEMLGVRPATLEQYGAVSEPVVLEMVAGSLENSRADWALAISGIAGPTGGTPQKPVGTVCFAWGRKGELASAETCLFAGDRRAVRAQAVQHALDRMLERLRTG